MRPSPDEILDIAGMRAAEAYAIGKGVAGGRLMAAAGRAVAGEIVRRWSPRPVLVLCGPGNNGGDGFVAAVRLAELGWPVRVALHGARGDLKGDALAAAQHWKGPVEELAPSSAEGADLIVDALFGTGLARPLEGAPAALAAIAGEGGRPVVAIDVPSGLHGDRACADGAVFRADLTLTFHRKKPCHVLEPGRSLCGEVVIADIGVPAGWCEESRVVAAENHPGLWPALPCVPTGDVHKHRRGRLAIASGGARQTGAARLAASAGLRAGAGLVTLLSPPGAMLVNAGHLTAVMLARYEDASGLRSALDAVRATGAVLGPALGVGAETRALVIAALSHEAAIVLDADALTSFENETGHLFGHLREGDVLTPHGGEFERLFPGLLDESVNRIDAVRTAAARAGAVVLLKGADTVIAAPDGRVRVNLHASPALATAGTGDVLAGIVGAFLAQGADAFDAASAAAWLHGEASFLAGDGMTAEDLPGALPRAFEGLARRRSLAAARARLFS